MFKLFINIIKNKDIFIDILKNKYIFNEYDTVLKLEYNNTIYFRTPRSVIYNKLCNSGYQYNKYYYIIVNMDSYIHISKNDSHKNKYFNNILYKDFNIYYIYFIYNKYYSIFNSKKDYFFVTTIYAKKIFNCRDYYMLHSFILDEYLLEYFSE